MLECMGCKNVFEDEEFKKVWDGSKTGKKLDQCSDRTIDLYNNRRNRQLYCRSCQRRWQVSNPSKMKGYADKFRKKKKQEKSIEKYERKSSGESFNEFQTTK